MLPDAPSLPLDPPAPETLGVEPVPVPAAIEPTPVTPPSPAVAARKPLDVWTVLAHPATQVAIVTAVALVIRLAYVLWLHKVGSYLYSDMEGANNVGKSFADVHHKFTRWDTIKPRAMGFVGGYLYRHFKANALQSWGLLQALLSTATVPLTYAGARRFFGHKAALISAVLLAVDYLAFGFAGFLMVETYIMFFMALSFALVDPERPWLCLLSGLALGVGALFKPQAIPVLPFWALLLFFWPRPQAPTSALARLINRPRIGALLLCVGTAAAVLPECIAVSQIVGKPTFLTAYGGQNFYIGHCPVRLLAMDGGKDGTFYSGVPKVYQRTEPWPDITFHEPVFNSGFFVQEGIKCMRRDGVARTALWAVEQLLDVFAGWPGYGIDPWPLPTGAFSGTRVCDVIIGYFLVPLGLIALWKRRRDRQRWGLWFGFAAPLAAVWGLALIFSGDPRYREPYDIFLIPGGCAALLYLWTATVHTRFNPRRLLGNGLRWIAARVDPQPN